MSYEGFPFYTLRPIRVTRRAFLAVSPAAFCSMLVTACTPVSLKTMPISPDLPERASVEDVPLIEQSAFHCGPAALAMVHQWAGLDVDEAEVAGSTFTPAANGTYQADMLGSARRRGQLAVRLEGSAALFGEVAAGHPVIVFQNLGLPIFPVWHYAVVVAYDFVQNTVSLHSGERKKMVMDMRLFQNTWRRGDNWAVVVLPPGRIPVNGREWDILEAAAALERVGKNKAAETTYRAGEERWPDHWIWAFGHGNALYAQGRLGAARDAFARAVQLDPKKPEAQKNLNEVTAQLARR